MKHTYPLTILLVDNVRFLISSCNEIDVFATTPPLDTTPQLSLLGDSRRAFVFYHHHLVEFPCSDPLAFGGAVAVRSQAASPRGPGHPREELTKLDNLGWRPAQTSSPLSLVLQHPIPRGQGNREPSYPPDPGKVARARYRHSAKGSQAGVGWRVFTRGQGKIPCSTRLQTSVT